MAFGQILFAAITWLCALFFAAIALWAFKRKTPMHLWAGTSVNPAEIRDVPAFNRANGLMWSAYTAAMALSGALALANIWAGTAALLLVCVPGSIALIIMYQRLYKKYRA